MEAEFDGQFFHLLYNENFFLGNRKKNQKDYLKKNQHTREHYFNLLHFIKKLKESCSNKNKQKTQIN